MQPFHLARPLWRLHWVDIRALSVRSAAPWIAIACLVFAGAAGCGDDDSPYATSIGLACRGGLDCAPGESCERGKEFGDGACTYACRDHFECPRGAACVNVSGGSCLAACTDDTWCRPGFHCKRRVDRVGPSESFVCVK
jgi:hypothetical protein